MALNRAASTSSEKKKKFLDYTYVAQGPPTAQQAAQSVLEQGLFLQVEALWKRIVMATKDADGLVTWVTLDPEYHKVLIKTAIVLCGQTWPSSIPVPAIKEALFSYLLCVLNGRLSQTSFFEKKKAEALANRANRERKRLQRKRSRAAKREREREAAKIAKAHPDSAASTEAQPQQSAQTRKCANCKKRFASRKKLSRHKCTTVLAADAPKPKEVTERQREARRARRAKARRARRTKAAEEKAAEQATKKKQIIRARVTESFGNVPECEDCDEEAQGAVIHGSCEYPKCLNHGKHRYEFKTFEEMFWKTNEKA